MRNVPTQPKMAQRLAEEIERDILGNERPAGECLGTISELMDRYGAGRATLREALVLIARDGLAEVRRGKVGGLFVTAPSERLIAAGLQTYLDLVINDVEEVWRIRRELEGLALELAIDRFTAADIPDFEQLQARFRAAEDSRTRLALGAAILRKIAATSRNPFLSVLVTAFSNLSIERFARSHTQASTLFARADETAALRSEQLAAVIGAARGRALTASAAIFDIFESMSKLSTDDTSADPGLLAEVAELAQAGADAQKLAGKVSQRIKERIVSEGLSDGAHLGSEPELMAAYGVSRGVLREAVRVLERLSIVRMVRGKGGGLRVLTPTPGGVVRSTCVYLRTSGMSPRHLQELGEVMGCAAAEMAARNVARLDREDVRARVEGLAELKNLSLRELAFSYHDVISDLSGSRAIGLVMSTLANLYVLDDTPSADQTIVKAIIPERLRDLMEAILLGDVDLSRRRMMMLRRSGARIRQRSLARLDEPDLLNVLKDPTRRKPPADTLRLHK